MTSDRRATRDASRVALVTCADLPELEPDDRALVPALGRLGVAAVAAVWDDPAVDWSGFGLVVLRSPWDYPDRRAEFLAWAAGVPALANPLDVVTWSTDKRYLVELDLAGLPVVPTSWLASDDAWQPPRTGEWVVKPAVGVGSKSCGRYRLADPVHRRLAGAHVARLQQAGQLVMVQPYQRAVDRYGETAVLFLADPAGGGLRYSHAVRKGPMLAGPDRPSPELYRPEQITERVPSAAELSLARRVLAEIPGGPDRLLYARVDLIPGADGRPQLVELELAEPSLFLGHEPGAAARLAAAIAARLHTP
ncbi:MAG: hypothetical protein ACRDT2_09200 [Natronosporangium sp.]